MDNSHRVFFFVVTAALFIIAWLRHGPPKKRSGVGIDGSAAGGSGGGSGGDFGGGGGGDCGGGGGGDGGCGGG
jgi:hypothetical protein